MRSDARFAADVSHELRTPLTAMLGAPSPGGGPRGPVARRRPEACRCCAPRSWLRTARRRPVGDLPGRRRAAPISSLEDVRVARPGAGSPRPACPGRPGRGRGRRHSRTPPTTRRPGGQAPVGTRAEQPHGQRGHPWPGSACGRDPPRCPRGAAHSSTTAGQAYPSMNGPASSSASPASRQLRSRTRRRARPRVGRPARAGDGRHGDGRRQPGGRCPVRRRAARRTGAVIAARAVLRVLVALVAAALAAGCGVSAQDTAEAVVRPAPDGGPVGTATGPRGRGWSSTWSAGPAWPRWSGASAFLRRRPPSRSCSRDRRGPRQPTASAPRWPPRSWGSTTSSPRRATDGRADPRLHRDHGRRPAARRGPAGVDPHRTGDGGPRPLHRGGCARRGPHGRRSVRPRPVDRDDYRSVAPVVETPTAPVPPPGGGSAPPGSGPPPR